MLSLLPLSFTCMLIPLILCKVVLSKTAVIVGGGPAGMATGLMLQQRGWSTTIIEKRPEFVSEDESKSYSYFLDGRGRKMTDMLNISHQIAEHAITNHQFKTVTMFLPNNERKPIKLPPNPSIGQIDKYWIPRPKFMQILQNCISQSNNKLLKSSSLLPLSRSNDDNNSNNDISKVPIEMIFGAECTHFSYSQPTTSIATTDALISSPKIFVHANVYDKESNTYKSITTKEADLVIACDGINSAIRSCLVNLTSSSPSATISDGGGIAKNQDVVSFQLSSFPSPAAGLLYKMLPITNDEYLQLPPEEGMSIRSVGKSKRSFLSLGMLPTKKGLTRSFNFICRADHDLWRVRTVDELAHYLNISFPQLHPLDRFVSQEGLRSFLDRAPGMFPRPQHANTLAALVTPAVVMVDSVITGDTNIQYQLTEGDISNTSQSSNGTGSTGVVLLGDAAHAFPPDTGQGINSALEDVYVFKQTLDACHDNLTQALPLYHKNRIPDIRALCELVSFSYPYQYNQDHTMKQLYMLHFALRMGLNIINKAVQRGVDTVLSFIRLKPILRAVNVPILFHPPAIQVVGNENLSYSEVLRRVTLSTVIIETILLSVLVAIGVKNLQRFHVITTKLSGGIKTGNILQQLKILDFTSTATSNHHPYAGWWWLRNPKNLSVLIPLVSSFISFIHALLVLIHSTIFKKVAYAATNNKLFN